MAKRYDIGKKEVILHIDDAICHTQKALVKSDAFSHIIGLFCDHLKKNDSPFIEPLLKYYEPKKNWSTVTKLLRMLLDKPIEKIAAEEKMFSGIASKKNIRILHEFAERFYTYWRSHDRYVVLHSSPGPSRFDRRPYRSFNATVETFEHMVRGVYRDICENITGDHPRIYRQVSAGCDVAVIALHKKGVLPKKYAGVLEDIPFITQLWVSPPVIIDPPMNKRKGTFVKVGEDPIANLKLDSGRWLCFPAKVGPVTVFIYFNQFFISLGTSLANLFELATDEEISKGSDAIFVFGVPPEQLSRFGDHPTVFHDDKETNLMTAAIPAEEKFGYFGYLKKMTLTLHNIVMMKRGRMPYHGAMVKITLKSKKRANILIIGDTATGKSEMLEAFRVLGSSLIRDLRVIADDMGSLGINKNGRIIAYGTEIGAFIRLDDLRRDYVFEQVDRAIIMSPQKVNARVVVPVTTMEDVLEGNEVNIILYANNYEDVDEERPIIQRFKTEEEALKVFSEGTAMTKGTTTAIGIVHNYFANIFGPPQYRKLHEKLANDVFHAAFKSGIYVGQIRTRLGMPDYETKGPEEAAKALSDVITHLI